MKGVLRNTLAEAALMFAVLAKKGVVAEHGDALGVNSGLVGMVLPISGIGVILANMEKRSNCGSAIRFATVALLAGGLN